MKSFQKFFQIIEKFIPFIILGILAYGLLVPWLGYYYDDWPFAWISHRLGSVEFLPAFRPYRPFLGPLFVITTSILGEQPWIWHLSNIIIRILLSICSYWSLKQIWPTDREKIFWVSLLFLINPGFNQQWVSMTHMNQAFIPHLAQIFSFGLMIFIPKKSNIKWTTKIGAFVLTFLGIFSTEYFLSLELLRPFFIWISLKDSGDERNVRLLKTIKLYIPYLILLIINIFWLIFYQSSSAYGSYRVSIFHHLRSNPQLFLTQTLTEFINSFFLAGLKIWGNLFNIFMDFEISTTSILSLLVGLIAFLFLYRFLIKKNNKTLDNLMDHDEKFHNEWAIQAVFLGGIGILLGKLPSWSIGLPLSTEFPNDRLMLPLLLCSSLFFVGIVEFLIINNIRKTYLLILICSLAVSHHFSIANTYRRDWVMQNDFFQQLMWRAPGLERGTILLTHETPMNYVTDNSLSAAINWLYEPENQTKNISYMLAYTKARPGSSLIPELVPGGEINYRYRTMRFVSNLDQALVFFYPTDGCLRVLDSTYTNLSFFPDEPYQLTDNIFLSDLSTIKPIGEIAEKPNFVNLKNDSNWCFFFQKAELARQNQKWDEVIDLYDQAKANNLHAQNPNEYLVFIEAMIHKNQYDRAKKAILEHVVIDGNPVDGTCYTLNRILSDMSGSGLDVPSDFFEGVNCL